MGPSPFLPTIKPSGKILCGHSHNLSYPLAPVPPLPKTLSALNQYDQKPRDIP